MLVNNFMHKTICVILIVFKMGIAKTIGKHRYLYYDL